MYVSDTHSFRELLTCIRSWVSSSVSDGTVVVMYVIRECDLFQNRTSWHHSGAEKAGCSPEAPLVFVLFLFL